MIKAKRARVMETGNASRAFSSHKNTQSRIEGRKLNGYQKSEAPIYLPLDKHENDRQDRSPCPSEIIELRQELRYIFSDASGMETFVDSIFRREQE